MRFLMCIRWVLEEAGKRSAHFVELIRYQPVSGLIQIYPDMLKKLQGEGGVNQYCWRAACLQMWMFGAAKMTSRMKVMIKPGEKAAHPKDFYNSLLYKMTRLYCMSLRDQAFL